MTRRQRQEGGGTRLGELGNGVRRLGLLAALATSLVAVSAGAAQASTITVGSVLPPGATPTKFEEVQTFFNTALPEKGVNLVSPVNGAIVRWSVQGAEGGPFFLRVLRPNGSGGYMGAGTSGGVTPSSLGLQTFTANLPVKAGDLIGVDPTNASDKIGVVSVAGANFAKIFPPPAEGATKPIREVESGKEIELSAEVQPAPAIGSLAPNFGSIAGGASVTINGTDLNGASSVKFGTVPATGFTVESENKITAIAPPGGVPGPADVTVTTLAGTSPTVAADKFYYQACVVPKLKGKQLKAAKNALRRADCKLGKVKGKHTRAAKVIKQSPKPSTILAPESKVNIKLGVAKKHKRR
jgi:PASTA domain-containing protein/IPT/TIG domain-containing protein